jgi:UDPglucose 6-dehydrogenase
MGSWRGGPTIAIIALKCPDIKVTVVDLSQSQIDAWNSDDLPSDRFWEDITRVSGREFILPFECDTAIIEMILSSSRVNTPNETHWNWQSPHPTLKLRGLCPKESPEVAIE